MVDGRRFGEFALADGALAVLPREHRLVILPRQPVSVLELLLAAALTLRGEPGGAKVRVRRVSLFLARGLSRPLLRSERRTRASVLLFVGAVLGEQLLTVVRVFRVALSCGFVPALVGRLFLLVAFVRAPFLVAPPLVPLFPAVPVVGAALSRALFPGRRRHDWSVSR